MSDLFADVESLAGLPGVVSRPALRRALARAGVVAEALTCGDLQRALAELHMTMRVYHGDDEAEQRLARLRALCEGEGTR